MLVRQNALDLRGISARFGWLYAVPLLAIIRCSICDGLAQIRDNAQAKNRLIRATAASNPTWLSICRSSRRGLASQLKPLELSLEVCERTARSIGRTGILLLERGEFGVEIFYFALAGNYSIR